jgi:hypothetical protein
LVLKLVQSQGLEPTNHVSDSVAIATDGHRFLAEPKDNGSIFESVRPFGSSRRYRNADEGKNGLALRMGFSWDGGKVPNAVTA